NHTADLVNDLKAISDTNRMDILISLKSGKKYARELMDLTGLTSATISHHMGELITRQLVTVEKSGVRLYYTLKKEKISEITDGLRDLLT
ncbi:MAG: metalloregulator ArsR/SmtB family transcription factor, partial [Clostridia bacterium]